MIPASAGIGFRRTHEADFLNGTPAVDWLEVHSENYFCAGAPAFKALLAIRERYPVSLHGVGLSIGSADPLDERHLMDLCNLINAVEPDLVSEHLCWGAIDGHHTNDLLPLPYTEEAMNHCRVKIAAAQDYLRRPLLIENVSSYVSFNVSTIPEAEFLVALARSSGCRLLLDVNNVYVTCSNHDGDAEAYIDAIPGDLVGEVHLAGHSVNDFDNRRVLIDTHGDFVCPAVWRLYERLIRRIGPRPSLLEWDTDIPTLDVLLEEADRANVILRRQHADAA